ncbi:hypothetical protein GCM10027577_45260 [Spirosoma fluminis]
MRGIYKYHHKSATLATNSSARLSEQTVQMPIHANPRNLEEQAYIDGRSARDTGIDPEGISL